MFLSFISCKKNPNLSSSHSFLESKFRFSFNGIKYELPGKEGTAEWVVDATSFSILRPDITNGIIRYVKNNCAYFEPGNARMVNIGIGGGCEVTLNGAQIDPAVIYLFHTGSFKISYKNCVQKSQYDIFTGITHYYDVCDADGTFELVLKNSENKTIAINEGSFEMYSYRF